MTLSDFQSFCLPFATKNSDYSGKHKQEVGVWLVLENGCSGIELLMRAVLLQMGKLQIWGELRTSRVGTP